MLQSVNPNLVARQPAQARGVSGPVTGRIGGHTPIVVQVYALGRGVTIEGQRGNLPLREGTLKFDAHGKILVLDPLAASHAHGHIAPVKGNIAAVGQVLQAVDQEDLPNVGHGAGGQFSAPLKTVILSLPPGSGKTLLGGQIAKALGCHGVVDEWALGKLLTAGALHLTNEVVEVPE